MRSPTEDAAFLAAIVESSDDAIITKDFNGIITSWNQSAQRIFGYTAEEVIGQSITILIPPERFDEEPAILSRIRKGVRVDHYETIRRRKDGSLVDISLTISPIRNEEGRIVGASKIARDISAQKSAAEEHARLLESERVARARAEEANRIKDEFLATLSHELRNPLNVIVGYAEVLLRSEEAKRIPFVKRAGETVKRNALIQSQLVRDLLDLSRVHTGKISLNWQTVSLNTTINNALETVHAEAVAKGLELKVEMPDEAVFVNGDPLRLDQVAWNLFNNAVKFTPSGGTITIRLSTNARDAVLLVEDTGQGIDRAFLPHVFEMFRQADASKSRRHGGLGVGLALVDQLVRLQGGSVTAESAGRGQGAQFTVRLPKSLETETDEPLPPSHEIKRGALDHLRVLVVDDSPDTSEMLCRLLEMQDARVATAASGDEALRLLENADFDVILSDISMPGMDGFEMLSRLRSMPGGADIPVLALTGFGSTKDVEHAKAHGFFSHVTKPIDIARLDEILRSLPARNQRSVGKSPETI